MKSTLLLAALFAATTASAQSSILLPNNSAGTEMDTPPILPSAPAALVPAEPGAGATRENAQQLAGPKEKESDAADRDRDLRRDRQERLGDAPPPSK